MNSSKNENIKVPIREKMSYASGQGGSVVLSALLSSFLLSYYTDTVLINAAAISTMFLISRVCLQVLYDIYYTDVHQNLNPFLHTFDRQMCGFVRICTFLKICPWNLTCVIHIICSRTWMKIHLCSGGEVSG